MKKLSLLFAFVGFFALTNVSAQNAKCCVLPDGTCILCPASKTCEAKVVKTCTPAETASCKKMVDNGACQKSATATTVAIKSVEQSSCQKATNTAKATTVANKSTAKTEGNTCCGLPITCCSKTAEKATQTGQLAQKSN